MDMEGGFEVRPIGVVRNGITERTIWEEVESDIFLDEKYTQALEGLDDFSHIIVVFWIHEARAWEPGLVRPMGREDLPEMGTFATRSPTRPNPVGVTAAELLGRQGTRLKVLGLDALDGTPVLDIKPYIPYGDRVDNPRIPEWVRIANEEKLDKQDVDSRP